MSIYEPRCMACGCPLDKSSLFEKDARNSEVCSDSCYKIYMQNDDDKLKKEGLYEDCKK